MGKKNKRQKLKSAASSKNKSKRNTSNLARPSGVTKSHTSKPYNSSKPKLRPQSQHSAPTIPFKPDDRILLIGEGDLSFACSLIETHHCTSIIATVYESREGLEAKYPYAGDNVRTLEENGARVVYGVDATKVRGKAGLGGAIGLGMVDRVIFNFPHVGGKSTDVNRQVRYNQELLVLFFKNAIPSLAASSPGSPSSIVVTLFEGEPYTLWNIRDLARHSGLQVERSFKFQAEAYPGYKHARTLGAVRGKNGDVGGGWKGEERAARSFVFVRKGEAPVPGISAGWKGNETSDEEEEELYAEEQSDYEGWDDNDGNNEQQEKDEV